MNKYLKLSLHVLLLLLITNAHSQESNKEILEFEKTKLNAELGNADAQYSLALYYEHGMIAGKKVTEKNDSLYAKWLHKSAEQEYADAYYTLALYYQYDKKDTEKAIFWHKKYADAKYSKYVMIYGEEEAKEEIKDIASIESLKDMGVTYRPWESYNYNKVESHWILKEKSIKLTAIFEEDGFRWIQIDSLGFMGALSVNRDIIVPCKYRSIGYLNDGFLVHDNTTLSGLYNKNGKMIISPYQIIMIPHIVGISCYIYGNHKFGVVQNTGKTLIPQIYKDIQCYGYGNKNSDGLYYDYYFECCTFDNIIEIYDRDFKLIIPKERKYNEVTLYSCKNHGVLFFSCTTINPIDNYRSAVCDLNGNELIKTKYTFTNIYNYDNGNYIYQIQQGRGLGLINHKGDIITNLQGQEEEKILLTGNQYYLISDINDIWRVEDKDCNIIISNMLNGGYIIKIEGKSYFKTQINDNIVIFNEDGDCIIDEKYNYYDIRAEYGYFLCTNSDGKTSLHDKHGKLLYQATYDILKPYKWKCPYIIFSENNKYGVLNFVDNNIIIPPLFDEIDLAQFSPNYLLLKQGGHYGLCDSVGNIVLNVEYNGIEKVYNGIGRVDDYLRVKKDGFCGIYKSDGTQLISPDRYTNIQATDTGFEAEIRVKGNSKPLLNVYFAIEGLIMDQNERERLLHDYERDAKIAFRQGKYKKSAKYYSLAIEIDPEDEYLLYNRGISYYNRNKFINAITDFKQCINIPNCSKDLQDKAINLIKNSEKYQAEKIQRRNELAGALLGVALATTAVVLDNQINSSVPSYNTNNVSIPHNTESVQVQQWNQQLQQLMTSTAIQVNNQEMQEYYNFCAYNKKADGSDYTLSEWRAIQGQAIQNLKDQGYDIIAENKKIIEQQKSDFAEQREEDKKAWFARYGYDISSSTTSSGSEKLSTKTDDINTNQPDLDIKNVDKTNINTDIEDNIDSKEQYKSKRVSSDDYHFEKHVTLYIRDANRNKVMFSNKDLCKKGAHYYVKIDNTYYLVNEQGGWGFNSSILYSHSTLYFDK